MFWSSDNQDGSDWRDEDEKLPGHENLTEKDIELFRHIQELALQVRRQGRESNRYSFNSGAHLVFQSQRANSATSLHHIKHLFQHAIGQMIDLISLLI